VSIAQSADLLIRYRSWGDERPGLPLVLIHGAAAGAATWMDVGRRLGSVRRTLALDLPGHGQSGPLPLAEGTISIDAYRDCLGWLCARLGVGRSLLVGHSMGGAIALAAALAWPDKVAGVVVLAAGTRLLVAPATLSAIAEHFPRFPDLVAATCYSPATPADLARRWAQAQVQSSREVALADFQACSRFDVRDRIATLAMPLFCVGAADDLMVAPRHVERLAQAVTGARYLLLERAGHNLHHERPDELCAAVLGFADTVR
jgi:pimeloyl-ACP methyl ester carboxylesterase